MKEKTNKKKMDLLRQAELGVQTYLKDTKKRFNSNTIFISFSGTLTRSLLFGLLHSLAVLSLTEHFCLQVGKSTIAQENRDLTQPLEEIFPQPKVLRDFDAVASMRAGQVGWTERPRRRAQDLHQGPVFFSSFPLSLKKNFFFQWYWSTDGPTCFFVTSRIPRTRWHWRTSKPTTRDWRPGAMAKISCRSLRKPYGFHN